MSSGVQSTKEQAAEAAGTAKDKAQEQASAAMKKSSGMVRQQVDQRSTEIGSQAQGMAGVLRQTASQLRSEGDPQQARYAGIADQGAERLEHVGGYLQRADADELLGKAEDLARRQPWLIAGAGLLIGIAVARVLGASSSERYRRSQPLRPLQPVSWEAPPRTAAPIDTPTTVTYGDEERWR